jgi:hypothetical protein
MTPSDKFQIEQIAPRLSLSWALTEWFRWNQQVNDVLKRDVDGTLFTAAYDAVDWEKYYERLRGTPFYHWAVEGGGILTFGGPYHVEHDCFFSHIADTSTVEGYWLREHPEFNHVLHDIHVETTGQMIDFILAHAPKKKRRKRRRKRSQAHPGGTVFKAGNSVVVRPGTMDPDFDTDLGGWQGRVLEAPGDEDTVLIRWDSRTLRAMPDSVIEQSMGQGLNWTEMILETHDVELAGPRDTKEDVARAIAELSKKHAWKFLGEEGRRIREILAGVDPDDEMALLDAWEDHLVKHLVFPFEAQVSEYQARGPLRAGDRVTVRRISTVDDLYGIIVRVTHRRRLVAFPLCDLEVTDERSPNYQLVEDYGVWFANR